MTHDRHAQPPRHAEAAKPTLSLLRMSALERLAAAGLVLGFVWVLVIAVLA